MPGLLPDILQDPLPDPLNPMAGLPPGRQIGPTGPSSSINPVMGSTPAGPGISALFGGEGAGSPGAQALSDAGAALAASGSGTPDFTPSTLQSIVSAVAAGRESLKQGKIVAADKRRREKLVEALGGAGTSEERVKVYRDAMFQFVADDKPKMIDAMQGLIDAEDPDIEYTTISLGEGQYLTYNDKNADVIAGGTKLPYDPVKVIGRPVGKDGVRTSERVIGYHPPGEPENVTWTNVFADAPKADGTAGSSSGMPNEDTSLAGLNIGTAVDGYTQLFNNVDLDAPFDPANYRDGPQVFRQWALTSKNPFLSGLARAVSDSRQEGFAFANNLAKEALGRISSGAVINAGELQTFRDMLPAANEDPRVVHLKMLWMRDFNNILRRVMNDPTLIGAQKGEALRTEGIWNEADRQLLGLDRTKTGDGGGLDPFAGLRPEG